MSGIYIHIPFCKQACHYCDFHFSTQLKKKVPMLGALKKELELRKNELGGEMVDTIYFGGGTPSVLETDEINALIETIYDNYQCTEQPEITLEANPDDLSGNRVAQLSKSPINRLSIGVQSFFEEDLKLMNRAHDAAEARSCIEEAKSHFDNISIDLIYGIPGMIDKRWLENIETALSYDLPHVSSYALTVEPKTALKKFIDKGIVDDVDDEQAQRQFYMLLEQLENRGYINYEISNFGKPGYFSRNNTSYWKGKTYLGIGPSAHSFDGKIRGWNVANNTLYIKSLEQGELPMEKETLSVKDQYNEYVMTGLRTVWGVSENKIASDFGPMYLEYFRQHAQKYLDSGHLQLETENWVATKKGKFLVDGIASDLFMINLES